MKYAEFFYVYTVMGKILWTMYLKYLSKYCLRMYLKWYLKILYVFEILWSKYMLYLLYFNNKIQNTIHRAQGDSDVISSYHIYASCFSAML